MFIKFKDEFEFSNVYVSYADITADDVVVLDEEIDDEQHIGNMFRITNDEFVRFTQTYKNLYGENREQEEAIQNELVKVWRERGLGDGPIFGARVVRGNDVHDVSFEAMCR